MSNRYIKTLSDKTDVDIRKIVSVSGVSEQDNSLPMGQSLYGFTVNTQGVTFTVSFGTEKEAKEERMRLIEIWYSIAAEDAMNSGILHYETREE